MTDEQTLGFDAYGNEIREGDTVAVLHAGHVGIEGEAVATAIEPGWIVIERESGLHATFDTDRLVRQGD